MTLAVLAMLGGFALLVWSADRFVEGAAATAGYAGMPPLLIGMVVVGFGTSAPEMVISTVAALKGSPNLALGNALGSNIANIGLVLGITALVVPLAVHSRAERSELPLLLVFSVLVGALIWDGALTRSESLLLLGLFLGLMSWTIFRVLRQREDHQSSAVDQKLADREMPLRRALLWLTVGLLFLILSSRILVWGAVSIAQSLGVSDLIIGLTIVALGTSLPELATSITAARKGEHDIAIGNVVGSGMFNLLAVIGIAGAIAPMQSMAAEVRLRDWPTMIVMTVALFIMAHGFRGAGRINRYEGLLLLAGYIAYNVYLIASVIGANG